MLTDLSGYLIFNLVFTDLFSQQIARVSYILEANWKEKWLKKIEKGMKGKEDDDENDRGRV